MITRFLFLLLLAPALAQASGGSDLELEHAYTNITNHASLQRGAQTFVNYCLSCHSATYMRYARLAKDLELTEIQVTSNLMFTKEKIAETMDVAMDEMDAKEWFGAKAPDLSLVARYKGVNWIYNYLKGFYPDESRKTGWNNTVFPNASMPNVLWEFQGIRQPIIESHKDEYNVVQHTIVGWETVSEGKLSEKEFDQKVLDLVTFLEYLGEPAVLQRQKYGLFVLLFLALMTFLTYLLKLEYWRDIH